MPFGDRTGPAGLGPMTGRAAGFCAGYPVPGYINPVGGRGYWGRGGGRRNWYYATGLPGWARAGFPAYGSVPGMTTVPPENELADLKEQSRFLQNTLDEISKRIEELEKAEQKK